ncbi:hypothetical protein [Chloroflexus sp.]|uniref:hypothetical protein n=1 Tax=Chloroflexus sp. TaxID=1904827 RepID=UPI002ACECBEF|nr:hypothetical protein [Chloroflexus sp.]
MPKRILIVDDDSNIRRLVALALTDDTPYEVSDVSSAEAALLHISRHPVDLYIHRSAHAGDEWDRVDPAGAPARSGHSGGGVYD